MKRSLILILLCIVTAVRAASVTVHTNGPATYDGMGKLIAGTGLGFTIQVTLFMSNPSCVNQVLTIPGNASSSRIDIKQCAIDKVTVEVMDGKLQGIKKEVVTSNENKNMVRSYSLSILNFGNDIGLEMMAMLALFGN